MQPAQFTHSLNSMLSHASYTMNLTPTQIEIWESTMQLDGAVLK